MIQFQCDYNNGVHPLILQRLLETNDEQSVGYGLDPHCDNARRLIREACQRPDADVHFMVGGTQTNVTVIASILRAHQGVICATSGHINVHETGALEHIGHKCVTLPHDNGLISAEQIEELVVAHRAQEDPCHCVEPAMVYISFSSEYGTIYSKAQLTAISEVCHRLDLPLFIDGARMGYGLTSPACDITLPELAQLADVFYLGGTKQGAMFGEAIVITSEKLKKGFRYNIKQNGGMLAKGRMLGIQFETLFTNNLYFKLAKHANDEAQRLKKGFVDRGYKLFMDSPTNQQFVILTKAEMDRLGKDFFFEVWEPVDADHIAVRFCTSWATKPEHVDALLAAL